MLIDLRTKGLNIYFLCPFIGSFCLIGAFFTSSKSIFGKYSIYQNILVSISQIFAIIPYLDYQDNSLFIKTFVKVF